MSIASPAAHFEATPAATSRTAQSPFAFIRRVAERITDAIRDANERRAHREIVRFIARNGGLSNDDVERQIGNRFSNR